MSKITIEITAPVQDFSVFADELGYLTEVLKTPEELALLAEPISIQDRVKPNPQNKQQFLEEYFKKIVVNELYSKKSRIIDNQINAAKEAEKLNLRSALSSVVGVTSTI